MSLKKPELKHHLSDVVQQVINNKRENEAHAMFRAQPGHGDKTEEHISPGIEHPGSTGVIYVTERATANGFYYGNPEWSNLGQGAPEVGDIPGANPKPKSIDLEAMGMWAHEYSPVSGVPELRKKVAEYYNATYRQGKSQFTAANIAIVPGGRAGLARVASCIGPVMTGYSLPEYTAYESLLGCFKSLIPIPTQLKKENGYKLDVEDIKREVRDRGYSAMMASNPRNPTGALVEGEELKEWVKSASDLGYTLILDEFYSHYILEGELGRAVSAAEYIDDIEKESVVLIDGLTKNWRCPGWRVCWVVGNSDMISAISQAGSYLDGGANHIFQLAALPLMELDHIKQDRLALQKHFRMKRDHIMKRLEKMGLPIKFPPHATFYLWVDLSDLPAPLNSGMAFAEELLREKCIVTPGIFFDVNPSHRRKISDSPCEPFIRLSYGPTLEECDRGLDAFERVLKKSTEDHSKHQLGTNYIPTKKD